MSGNGPGKCFFGVLKRCCGSPGRCEMSTCTDEFSDDFMGAVAVEKIVGACWLSSPDRKQPRQKCTNKDELLSFC